MTQYSNKNQFRGVSIATDEWVHGGYATWDNRHFIICFNPFFHTWLHYEVYPESVGQATGQQDRGGADIYDGDIVYVACEDEDAVISWNNETSRFDINFQGWCSDFDSFYGRELEIADNLYNRRV